MTRQKKLKLSEVIELFNESLDDLNKGIYSGKLPAAQNKKLNDVIEKYNHALGTLEANNIQQKLLEKSLQKSREAAELASHEKSRFLANMSHELRTPINGVIGIARLLQDTELTPHQNEHISILIDSANFLHGIINDILDLSKIEAGKMEIENALFQMDELIGFVKNTLLYSARKKNITLNAESDLEFTRFLYGDPLRIRQILINLISNALKFTPDGGHIDLRIRASETSDSSVRIHFEVEDTGIGLSPEVQNKLFKPFEQGDTATTRRFGGTGLGLSICKQLVELMNGRMGVESEVGKGSKFWFDLPIKLGPEAQNLIPEVHTSANDVILKLKNSKTKALMAEDHPINQIVMKSLLKKYGLEVDVVDTGIKAIEAVQSGDYQIVFMDCQMPEMDGYEATRHIRNLPNPKIANIHIVALTANAMKGDKELCIKTGMNGFVAKPINPMELEDELRIYFNTTEQQRNIYGA